MVYTHNQQTNCKDSTVNDDIQMGYYILFKIKYLRRDDANPSDDANSQTIYRITTFSHKLNILSFYNI